MSASANRIARAARNTYRSRRPSQASAASATSGRPKRDCLVFTGASPAPARQGHRTWAPTFATVVIVELIVALTAEP